MEKWIGSSPWIVGPALVGWAKAINPRTYEPRLINGRPEKFYCVILVSSTKCPQQQLKVRNNCLTVVHRNRTRCYCWQQRVIARLLRQSDKPVQVVVCLGVGLEFYCVVVLHASAVISGKRPRWESRGCRAIMKMGGAGGCSSWQENVTRSFSLLQRSWRMRQVRYSWFDCAVLDSPLGRRVLLWADSSFSAVCTDGTDYCRYCYAVRIILMISRMRFRVYGAVYSQNEGLIASAS